MNRKFFSLLATICFTLSFTACSDSDSSNPFDEPKRGEFLPKEIVIKKNSDNRNITESWSNIRRNANDKIVSCEYSLRSEGDVTQVENSSYSFDYYTGYQGNEIIRTKVVKESTKSDRGIVEKYTENIQEEININEYGYISRISTTTDHFSGNSTEPVTTTSERTFTYNGDLCKGSVYRDENYIITYKYNWNGYMLSNITILKENLKDGSVEYNTYDYTFDRRELYPYAGTEILPFVQSGMPQIYASMGYLGKCTPYILSEEVQGGYTKFGGMTFENIRIHNTYHFGGDAGVRLRYDAAPSSIYNEYSITFIK